MQRKGSLVLHGVKALALAAQAEVKPLEHPTLHAMVILVDDLFGSNQTQSDAIRGHQRSSAVISGPVWIQSDAIRRNQRSSVVISGPVWIQSDAIRRNQTQSDAITHLFGCIARRRSVAIRKGQARGVTRGKVRGAPARMHRIALQSQAAGTRSRPREIYRPPTWARMHRRRPRWAYAPC